MSTITTPKTQPEDNGRQRLVNSKRTITMDQAAKHVIFKGHVQGVGFRYTARDVARRHDVAGFVRNLPDGTVEMLVQGHPRGVDHCIEDIQDSFSGYIRETQVEQVPWNAQYDDFRITF